MRTMLARLVAPWIAAALLWLGTRLAVEVDADLIERTTLVVVDVILLFGSALLTLYGGIHKALNRKINPADTAKPAPEAVPRYPGLQPPEPWPAPGVYDPPKGPPYQPEIREWSDPTDPPAA